MTLKETLTQQLETLTSLVEAMQTKVDEDNAALDEKKKERDALQAALDVLNSTGPRIAQYQGPTTTEYTGDATPPPTQKSEHARWAVKAEVKPPEGDYQMVNNERTWIEPGMQVGHNVWGEEVLVPVGTVDPPRMAAPSGPPTRRADVETLAELGDFSSDPNEVLGFEVPEENGIPF